MRRSIFRATIIAAGLALILCACGGGGSGGGAGTGTVSVSLTDAAARDYRAVYVTIDSVEVHRDGSGGWVTIATPHRTYNLLALMNGVRQELGLAQVAAGVYTQMRLIIGDTADGGINILGQAHPSANYVIEKVDGVDQVHPLTVPSGPQTGLKVVPGFEVSADGTTEILLDFDAAASVVRAGSSGKWQLKPTVKVLRLAEAAIVEGVITDGVDPLPGVRVTAQLYDETVVDPADLADQVTVVAGTITDAEGHYALFLAPGFDYNLVAFSEPAPTGDTTYAGYAPGCEELTATAGGLFTVDINLAATDQIGWLSGDIDLPAGFENNYALLSFRQAVLCGAASPMVEVKGLQIGDGGSYSEAFPAGDYSLVAFGVGLDTQELPATVAAGPPETPTLLPVIF